MNICTGSRTCCAESSSAGVLDTCGFAKNGWHAYRSWWHIDVLELYLCPHLDLNVAEGTIVPMICYTNCPQVKLFVDGKSCGVKAYEFPAQGMTKEWLPFDRPFAPVTTNDLHLPWDIPWTHGEVMAVGRDLESRVLARTVLRPSGSPASLHVHADREAVTADGRDVVQLEITLTDAGGQTVRNSDLPVTVDVTGGTLLGLDSGRMVDRTMYSSPTRETYGGRAFCVIRAAHTRKDR